MNNKDEKEKRSDAQKIWTIPNILSLIRIGLIPVIIWLYCYKQAYLLTAIVFVLSGLTDILDGFIARKFNLITTAGNILDPLADKLTQIAIVFCLAVQFVPMRVLLAVQVIKELIIMLLAYMTARKKIINSAQWFGKLCSAILFIVIVVHLLIPALSVTISWILSMIAVAFTVFSLVMYIRFFAHMPKKQ